MEFAWAKLTKHEVIEIMTLNVLNANGVSRELRELRRRTIGGAAIAALSD